MTWMDRSRALLVSMREKYLEDATQEEDDNVFIGMPWLIDRMNILMQFVMMPGVCETYGTVEWVRDFKASLDAGPSMIASRVLAQDAVPTCGACQQPKPHDELLGTCSKCRASILSASPVNDACSPRLRHVVVEECRTFVEVHAVDHGIEANAAAALSVAMMELIAETA